MDIATLPCTLPVDIDQVEFQIIDQQYKKVLHSFAHFQDVIATKAQGTVKNKEITLSMVSLQPKSNICCHSTYQKLSKLIPSIVLDFNDVKMVENVGSKEIGLAECCLDQELVFPSLDCPCRLEIFSHCEFLDLYELVYDIFWEQISPKSEGDLGFVSKSELGMLSSYGENMHHESMPISIRDLSVFEEFFR